MDDRERLGDRAAARRRAIRAAAAVTLGLASLATTSGCEPAKDAMCRTFANNRYCCERRHHDWDEAARTCTPPMAVPGPFVPPDLPG